MGPHIEVKGTSPSPEGLRVRLMQMILGIRRTGIHSLRKCLAILYNSFCLVIEEAGAKIVD